MKYKNEKIQVQWSFQDQLLFDFVWSLHPREGLYILKTLSFLSLFKMGFQSNHIFSYDSNLMLRNLLFVRFGKSLSKSINVQCEIGKWLASEFRLGDLFLHLLCIQSYINQFVSHINMFQRKNFNFKLSSGWCLFKLSKKRKEPHFFQLCLSWFWRDPRTKALSGCRLNLFLTWNLAHAHIDDGWSGNAIWKYLQNTSKV